VFLLARESYAKIPPDALAIIQHAEKEIKDKTGENVVLVAYDKEGK
jgi:hypothetical protein